VWEPSCEALDADQFREQETGRADLVRELLGAMEERGREPVRPALWVCVPVIRQVALDEAAGALGRVVP
jgi:hypothetical protein